MLELAIEMLLLVLDKAMEMPKMCAYVHDELLPSKIKTKQSYKRSLENLHVQLAFSFFT
jgi:hypothetical protein